MSQIHIFFFALSSRVKQVFSPLWFCVGGIRNPARVFLFRFPTPFFVPTILCTRPYHYRPVRIPSPKRLPASTRCLSRPCIQQQGVQWFHLFCDILYSVPLEPILLLLSTILSPPFVLAPS